MYFYKYFNQVEYSRLMTSFFVIVKYLLSATDKMDHRGYFIYNVI